MDKLHIPQKWVGQQMQARVRRATQQYAGDSITGDDIEDIVNKVFHSFGEIDRQNWLEVERWAGHLSVPAAGVSPYDATIDPSLASDPASHRYINLRELNSNETWSADRIFRVGVVGWDDAAFRIIESGSYTINGPIAIECAGRADTNWQQTSALPEWDLGGATITSTHVVQIRGLQLANRGTNRTRFFATANVVMEDCQVIGYFSGSRTLGQVTNGTLHAVRTQFISDINFGGAACLVDCWYQFSGLGNLTVSASDFSMFGGGFHSSTTAASTYTWSGGTGGSPNVDVLIVGAMHSGPEADNGYVNGSMTFSNFGHLMVDVSGGTQAPDISVTGNQLTGTIRGRWGKVAVTGTTNGPTWVDVIWGGSNVGTHNTMTITGPNVRVSGSSIDTTSQCILTGTGIHANIKMRSNAVPALQLTTFNDSVCTADLIASAGGTSKAYDWASGARSLLIVTGHTVAAGWGVVSTNPAGGTVIDHTGAPTTGAAGGDLTGTYPNPTVNGVAAAANDIKIGTVGKGLYVKEGANATMGTATLVAGTVVVNTTKVTANSRIFLTTQALGTVAVPKEVAVTARTAGTSFTITSADATDTSVVGWLIMEPA